MSAERLLSRNGPDFQAEVLTRQAQLLREGHALSPIGIFARYLKQEGRRGLLELEGVQVRTLGMIETAEKERTVEEIQQKKHGELAAIMAGCIVESVETTLSTGEFSLIDFVNDYNNSIRGTTASELPIPTSSYYEYVLTFGEWHQMVEFSKRNRTLTGFIEHPQNLPGVLQLYLYSPYDMQTMFIPPLMEKVDQILPACYNLAKHLVRHSVFIGDALDFDDKVFTPEMRSRLKDFLKEYSSPKDK